MVQVSIYFKKNCHFWIRKAEVLSFRPFKSLDGKPDTGASFVKIAKNFGVVNNIVSADNTSQTRFARPTDIIRHSPARSFALISHRLPSSQPLAYIIGCATYSFSLWDAQLYYKIMFN